MLASMLANNIEKIIIKALGKMSKDFGKNKIKYQTVPTTSRRMRGKNRCVKNTREC